MGLQSVYTHYSFAPQQENFFYMSDDNLFSYFGVCKAYDYGHLLFGQIKQCIITIFNLRLTSDRRKHSWDQQARRRR